VAKNISLTEDFAQIVRNEERVERLVLGTGFVRKA